MSVSGRRSHNLPHGARVLSNPPGANPPLQQPPATGGDGLGVFDLNGDCLLSDIESFAAVDAWLAEQIANNLFFAAVDAWIGELNVCAGVLASGIRIQTGAQGITLMQTSGDRLGSLVIYDVAGREGARLHGSGKLARWALRDFHGQRLANGIYFAQIGATAELKRFYVLR